MLSIAWFLVWGAIVQQSMIPQGSNGPIQLYQQAAVALQSDKPTQAIASLEQLVKSDSIIAPLAATRLAECYLSKHQPREALQLLVSWTPRLLELGEQDLLIKLDPSISQRAQLLTRSALAQLPEEDTQFIEQLVRKIQVDVTSEQLPSHSPELIGESYQVEPNMEDLKPVDLWLVSELARRYAKQNRYQESYQLLTRLGKQADPQQQKLVEFDLPLALLLDQPNVSVIQQFERSIEASKSWSTSDTVCAWMAVAEAQRKLDDYSSSDATLQRLAGWLKEVVTSNREEERVQIAQWQGTIDLRRAELMMARRELRQAALFVNECISKYGSYSELSNFRILAARCLIANVEFDAARDQLRRIIDDSSSKPAPVAQARWMLGELDFLQRNYPAASQQYMHVLQIADQPLWHARALIQLAKCHELQEAPLEALAAYRTVIDCYPQSDVADSARTRLAQLFPASADQSTGFQTNVKSPAGIFPSSETKSPAIQR